MTNSDHNEITYANDRGWCNCQAIEGAANYPGPWHPVADEPWYPCAQEQADDEVMLDVIGELPADLRGAAFMLALAVTAGDYDE